MTFVSYQFALFLPAVAALFYVCPKRWRMGTLLLASGLFLILSGGVRSLAVYGFSVFVAWAAALGSERFREENGGVARPSLLGGGRDTVGPLSRISVYQFSGIYGAGIFLAYRKRI